MANRIDIPTLALLLGSLLAGLGFACLLPPFEGFDETAHYSYVQQISQARTWPRLNDPISKEIEEYLLVAPSALSLQAKWTYKAFFASPPATISAAVNFIDTPNRDRTWRPGSGNNWQGQHPPLYYTLMAPLFSLSSDGSLKFQLFVLRASSYAIAWLGLIAMIVFGRLVQPKDDLRVYALGASLWPALFPMWFPEMARVGNDSLVLLCAACVVVLVHKALQTDATKHYAGLGVACGLGLLTKATFLPLVAAVGLVFFVRAIFARPRKLGPAAIKLATFGFAIVAVAGWWYARNFVEYGTIIGSNDEASLRRAGDLGSGLADKFSAYAFLRGLATSLNTFFWAGNWSFVQPPRSSKLPLILIFAVIGIGCCLRWRKSKFDAIDQIAVLALFMFIAAFIRQIFIFIAVSAIFSIGTWYLHSIAPVFSGLVGKGIGEALGWPKIKKFVVIVLMYPLAFLPFATAIQMLYFSGCGQMQPDTPYFDFGSVSCDFRTIWNNLAVLAYPAAGFGLFIVGWIAMTVGMLGVAKKLAGQARSRSLSHKPQTSTGT